MAAKSWGTVALECMRRPGVPTPYFPDSYALNEAPPLGRNVGNNGSSQYTRAVLVMGRYADSRAFSAATNPDFGELAYLSSANLSDLASRAWNEALMWCQVYVAEPFAASILLSTNTRLVLWDWRMLRKSISTGLWTQMAFDDAYSGHLVSPDFKVEYPTSPAVDSRIESGSGYRSVRPVYDAAAPYAANGFPYWCFHGYTGGNQFFTASDLAQIVISFRASLVLHDPAGFDDRDSAPFLVTPGIDYYPTPRTYQYPSAGAGKARRIRAKWPQSQFCVMHTMTEGQFEVPPQFAGAFETYDEAGGGSIIVPAGPAPSRGRWIDVYTTSPRGRWVDIAPAANSAPVWGASPQLLGAIGKAFSATVAVTSGSPAPTYSKVSGPSWASVSSGGAITGTPSGTPSIVAVVVRATNVVNSADITIFIDVRAASELPVITTTALPPAVVGEPYYAVIEYTGAEPVTVNMTGTPLSGLSRVGRVITGTPTAAGSTGSLGFSATNVLGTSATVNLSITATAAPAAGPAWVTSVLPSATAGSAVSTTVAATGATSYSVQFYTTAGAAPSITSGGALSVVAQAAGSYAITIRATNAAGAYTDRTFALVVQPVQAEPTARRTWVGPDGGGVSWRKAR